MNYRSNSILAYLPQNRDGESILKKSVFFQEALGMRIFLMDIIRSSSIFPVNPKLRKNQIRQQGALNKFTDFVKGILKTNLPNNIILRVNWGKPVNTLIRESEQGGYEFVIIDNSNSLQPGALNQSDTDRFISKSYCPVMSINKNTSIENISKIIVPIDIAQRTKKRLYWATFFAKKLKAKVQIVSALNVDMEATKSLAFKNAERLKNMLEQRRVECEVKILKVHKQEPHKVILDHIEQENPGMVIIRTHQEIHFSGKKIGRFVSEIVHNCNMPVFAVGGVSQDYDLDRIT